MLKTFPLACSLFTGVPLGFGISAHFSSF